VVHPRQEVQSQTDSGEDWDQYGNDSDHGRIDVGHGGVSQGIQRDGEDQRQHQQPDGNRYDLVKDFHDTELDSDYLYLIL